MLPRIHWLRLVDKIARSALVSYPFPCPIQSLVITYKALYRLGVGTWGSCRLHHEAGETPSEANQLSGERGCHVFQQPLQLTSGHASLKHRQWWASCIGGGAGGSQPHYLDSLGVTQALLICCRAQVEVVWFLPAGCKARLFSLQNVRKKIRYVRC